MRNKDFPMDVFKKKMFLGHTRNSSVGGITIKNAHPFEIGRITGAHNGRVANFWELKREFAEKDKSVDSFDVDSQIIFYMLDKFGPKSLSRIEGKVACWWIDKDIPNKVLLWIWKQELAVAEEPYMAFSSDEDHLRIAGFRKIKKLDDGGQVVFISLDDLDKGFRQQEVIEGKTSAVTYSYVDGWKGVTNWPDRRNHSKSLNAEETSHIGEIWNYTLGRWIKHKAYLNVISDHDDSNEEEIHRVLLVSIHIGLEIFQCTSCNQMITQAKVSQNANKQDIHVGCGGICHTPTDLVKRDVKAAAGTAIALFVGKVEATFAPRQLRAFIKNDKKMLEEYESMLRSTKKVAAPIIIGVNKQLHLPLGADLDSLCDVCLGCLAKPNRHRVDKCDQFRHVDGLNCCKMCIANCTMKNKDIAVSRCLTFEVALKPENAMIDEPSVGGVCMDCMIENCTIRGHVRVCHDKMSDPLKNSEYQGGDS